MKADFTRATFNSAKRYRAVLHQQGRVQLDADLNEAQSIQNDRLDESLTDVVGASGVPRDRAGFAIGVVSGGKDLTIGAGRLYAGGVAVVCDGARLNSQPHTFRRVDPATLTLGRHLVYVDVWERSVTALEDEQLREKALGGPDTAARSQVVWQIRLKNVADTTTCATLGAWQPTAPTGRLTAVVAPPTEDDSLCSLPPLGGYTRSENQLYRIEVHQAGPRDSAVFKWSRDNGAVAAAIVSASNATEVELDRLDPDTSFGFGDARFAEAADETTELDFTNGALLSVTNPDVTRNTVTVSPAATFQAGRKPKLRRWDGTFTGGAAPIALEGGLSVTLSAGDYVAGDYWTIPARALLEGLPGTIEWEAGAQAPHGNRHRYAALALIDVVAVGGDLQFSLAADCRDLFPPLTDIRASDVSIVDNCDFGTAKTVQDAIDLLCRRDETCTIVIRPGDDLRQRLGEIGGNQDAQVCFPIGEFRVPQTFVVEGRGHLKLSGAGKGTRLIAETGEVTLQFQGCKSVTVRDMEVSALRTGTDSGNLGTLTFRDCPEVLVEAVDASTTSGISRASAGIAAFGCSTVRIKDCDLRPGERGIGVLVVDADTAWITGCSVVTKTGAKKPLRDRLLDKRYRGALRSKLISFARITTERAPGPAGTKRNDKVTIGDFTVEFATPDPLKSGWQARIDAAKPQRIDSPQQAVEFLYRLVNELAAKPDGATGWAALNKWLRDTEAIDRNVASQGIVVAGRSVGDVRIEGNRLVNVQQGVHVGVSQGAASPKAGRVRVGDNTIGVTLTRDSMGERHGVFVGNCESLVIENNRISLERLDADQEVEGIRVYGHFGPFMLVRANHLDGFNVGVRARPFSTSAGNKRKTNLWRVQDNLLSGGGMPAIVATGVEAHENYPL